MNEDERIEDRGIQGVPSHGYIDATHLSTTLYAEEPHSISVDYLSSADASVLGCRPFRVGDEYRAVFIGENTTAESDNNRAVFSFDTDYNFNLDNTSYSELTLNLVHAETINPSEPIARINDFNSNKALVIEQFNKKCESCDKEECIVINCFIEFLFNNYHVIRKS